MHNDDIENALENKNYSFSLFCIKEFFCLKDVLVQVGVIDRKVPILHWLTPDNFTRQRENTRLEKI